MARIPHSVEKSAFRPGEYVLYQNGAQRIVRCADGWRVCGLVSLTGRSIYAGPCKTLQALVDKAVSIVEMSGQ